MKFKRTLAFCLCLCIAVVSGFFFSPVEKIHAATEHAITDDVFCTHLDETAAICKIHALGIGIDEYGETYNFCVICGIIIT